MGGQLLRGGYHLFARSAPDTAFTAHFGPFDEEVINSPVRHQETEIRCGIARFAFADVRASLRTGNHDRDANVLAALVLGTV